MRKFFGEFYEWSNEKFYVWLKLFELSDKSWQSIKVEVGFIVTPCTCKNRRWIVSATALIFYAKISKSKGFLNLLDV